MSRSVISPTWFWLAPAILAFVLGCVTLPSSAYFADDWMHAAAMQGLAGPERTVDLFRFFDGDPSAMQVAIDVGAVPWFADPELKIALWRPLTVALIHLDHALFGSTVLGPSVHSVLWYTLLCAVVGLVFRRVLPARTALVASLLFAVAATHVQAAGWIAGRGVLVSAVFGLAGLWLHVRWRVAGCRWSQVLSPLLIALGLAAGEAGIAAVIYVVAWEIAANTDGWRRRAVNLLPAVAISCLWLMSYALLDYGTHGSGAYISPVSEPLVYVQHVPQRLAFALGVRVAGLPADAWLLRAGGRGGLALWGAGLALPIMAWTASMLRHKEPEERRPLLFFALGATACLLPQIAGLLGARSFVLPSLGGSALLGALLLDALSKDGGMLWLRRTGAAMLLFAHVVVALGVWGLAGPLQQRMNAATDAQLKLVEDPDSHVLIVSVPDPWLGVYGPAQLAVQGRVQPASWHVLSLCECDMVLTRSGPRSVDLRADSQHLLHGAFAEIYRAPGSMERGDVVRFGDHRAEVLEERQGNPVSVRFTFASDLQDPAWKWLAWHDGAFTEFPVPNEGEALRIRWVASW